jgi:gluconate kinase
LLVSQFANVKPPQPEEPAISIDVGPAPGVIAQKIIGSLQLSDPTEVK